MLGAAELDAQPLRHLFDADLEFRDAMDAITGAAGRQGRLIGSGDGFVEGERISGQLTWTLFEELEETVAVIDHVLLISTADGAVVRFDAQGFAHRRSASDRLWNVVGALLFATDDPRYRWIDGSLGLWRGHYDTALRRARYRAYESMVAPPSAVSVPAAAASGEGVA